MSAVQGNGEDKRLFYLALNFGEGFDLLPAEPAQVVRNLRKKIAVGYNAAPEAKKNRFRRLSGCLHRLNAFLFQVSRLRNYAGELQKRPLPGIQGSILSAIPPGMGFNMPIFMSEFEVCTDFESLVFHARATLDRLSVFICDEYESIENYVFYSDLEKVLSNNVPRKDIRAKRLLECIQQASDVAGILTDLTEEEAIGLGRDTKSLRSRLIHYTNIQEGAQVAFTIHRLPDGRYLMFDCEAMGYPVLRTARALAEVVPFLTLNAVRIYLEECPPLNRSAFEPDWRNPTIVFNHFIDKTSKGPEFSVVRMLPSGFQWRLEHLREEVFNFAEPAQWACSPGD